MTQQGFLIISDITGYSKYVNESELEHARASPLAENLVRDARVCQGRQGRLLFHKRAQVQLEVRDVRLQRYGETRRRRHVANLLRAERVDRRRRGKDQRAREESGELSTDLATGPCPRRDRRSGRGVPTWLRAGSVKAASSSHTHATDNANHYGAICRTFICGVTIKTQIEPSTK